MFGGTRQDVDVANMKGATDAIGKVYEWQLSNDPRLRFHRELGAAFAMNEHARMGETPRQDAVFASVSRPDPCYR